MMVSICAAGGTKPIANGALVLSLDTDFDGCMAIVQRLAEEGTITLGGKGAGEFV